MMIFVESSALRYAFTIGGAVSPPYVVLILPDLGVGSHCVGLLMLGGDDILTYGECPQLYKILPDQINRPTKNLHLGL